MTRRMSGLTATVAEGSRLSRLSSLSGVKREKRWCQASRVRCAIVAGAGAGHRPAAEALPHGKEQGARPADDAGADPAYPRPSCLSDSDAVFLGHGAEHWPVA